MPAWQVVTMVVAFAMGICMFVGWGWWVARKVTRGEVPLIVGLLVTGWVWLFVATFLQRHWDYWQANRVSRKPSPEPGPGSSPSEGST